MNYHEYARSFSCDGNALVGIVSVPEQVGKRGVLIVVGGPQYRAGSHRQFALLARGLAQQGIAAMRFDYRGMGDSEGSMRNFENVDDDLRAAIDEFMLAVPGIDDVAIWGLCDAASAALFYARQDARVTGLALVNPWVRTDAGAAKATLKHYYRARLLDGELWKKIFGGRFDFAAAGKAFFALSQAALADRGAVAVANPAAPPGQRAVAEPCQQAGLPQRMQTGLAEFRGKVLLIISGADLTAHEFVDLTQASRRWRGLLAAPRVTSKKMPDANHTFSRKVWREQVLGWTSDWLRSW